MSRTAKEIETTGLPCEAQNGETIQVVPKIDVTMFGKFTLKQEGMEVPHAVSLTGRSRRLWTLTAYLQRRAVQCRYRALQLRYDFPVLPLRKGWLHGHIR